MTQEQAFLEKLRQAERFGFRFGDLLLGGARGELVFSRGTD